MSIKSENNHKIYRLQVSHPRSNVFIGKVLYFPPSSTHLMLKLLLQFYSSFLEPRRMFANGKPLSVWKIKRRCSSPSRGTMSHSQPAEIPSFCAPLSKIPGWRHPRCHAKRWHPSPVERRKEATNLDKLCMCSLICIDKHLEIVTVTT